MKTVVAWTFVLVLAFVPDAWAKPHKKSAQAAEHKISEVSGASITLSFGTSGDQHETYRVTSDTVVKLNGTSAAARDLRSGMMAKVTTSKDKTTALSIEAKDAPRHPKKGRVG